MDYSPSQHHFLLILVFYLTLQYKSQTVFFIYIIIILISFLYWPSPPFSAHPLLALRGVSHGAALDI